MLFGLNIFGYVIPCQGQYREVRSDGMFEADTDRCQHRVQQEVNRKSSLVIHKAGWGNGYLWIDAV